MRWWHVVVILLDTYLLLGLGPWIVLQMLEWLMTRSGGPLVREGERLRELAEMEQEQTQSWPQKPRPGRYEEPDRIALECLGSLRSLIAEAERLWPLVSGYSAPALTVVDVLALRCWRVLPGALAAWRNLRSLLQLLDQSDETLVTLMEQQQTVADIPARIRAALNDTRAEIRRLNALLEVEQEAGTLGLADTAQRLRREEEAIERSLDLLAGSGAEQLPQVVADIDEMLRTTGPVLVAIEQFISKASGERSRVQGLIVRLGSSLQLAEERWEGLKLRGAAEPSLSRSLAELRTVVEHAVRVAKQRTVSAYEQVSGQVTSLDGQLAALSDRLDALDRVMVHSKTAVEGDVAALAAAQAACDKVLREDPLVDLDQSLALIEKASQSYMEAERQRGLGTFQGYETSISEAETAMKHLAAAQDALVSLPEKVSQVREQLSTLASEAMGEWRSRAEHVRGQLQTYARHWGAGLAGEAAEAISSLDQVEVDVERIPPNVRYQRRFRQSELGEAVDILSHACQEMEKAKTLTKALEAENERIEGLRKDLANATEKLTREGLPALEQLKDSMLPELQQRFAAFRDAFVKQVAMLGDPSQVDYDECVTHWLPSIWQQLDELKGEHEQSMREYAKALREVTQRLERQWGRLSKLNPRTSPSSEEPVERLAKDLEDWNADVQRHGDSPLALRDIIGRRADALEQRIENARQQITEGRRTLGLLRREYDRRTQTVQGLRESVNAMQRESQWPRLTWDTEEAEKVWEKAGDSEHASRAAPALVTATDQLQQAVNAAQQAEQLFARTEHQMEGVLRRLDDELRTVAVAQERARRRVDELREAGASEELVALEAQCAAAERAVEMATAATTPEDALRHLRAARAALG